MKINMQICEVSDNFVHHKNAMIQGSLCPSFFNEMLNCTNEYYVCFITEHSLRAKHLSSKIAQGQQVNNLILQ